MMPLHRTRNDGVALFFILTLAFTWLLWIPAALTGQTNKELPTALLWLLGGFGPSIAGIALTLRYAGPGERRDFWRSAVDFRRIRLGWYALILLIFPVTFAFGIALDSLLGGQAPGMELSRQILRQPVMLLPVVISCLIGGPLSEELGWRGFALGRLVRRGGVIYASLVLAIAWGIWHLPLFFINGTNQFSWGFGSPSFWLFLANLVPLTFLMTCAYLENGDSILSGVLVHFMWAFTLSLLAPLSMPAQILQMVLFYTAVFSLVAKMVSSRRAVGTLEGGMGSRPR